MSESENIRFKKEILNLKILNAQLQEQNEELNNQIGKLQLMNMSNNNKNELINKSNLITQNKKILKANIEEVIYEEKLKLEKILKENENLKQNLKLYENKIKDNEIYIQKLQQENNNIKRQLIIFNNNHESKFIIDNERNRDDLIIKKEQEYQKLVFEWNELRNKMEEVLSENRILRQIGNVPDNFGIDISKIKMGDRIKIEDYKAKIRILENEIDNLESERAKLKHRLMFLNNSFQINEYPFNLLNKEQKVEVAKFAQDLYEGKINIQPGKYELIKENEILKAKISFLEDENYKFKTGRYNNINNNENLNNLVKSIVKEEKEKKENIQNNTNINLNTSSNFNNLNIILNSNNSNNINFYNNNNFERVLDEVNKKYNKTNSIQSNSSQKTNGIFIFFNIFSFNYTIY